MNAKKDGQSILPSNNSTIDLYFLDDGKLNCEDVAKTQPKLYQIGLDEIVLD